MLMVFYLAQLFTKKILFGFVFLFINLQIYQISFFKLQHDYLIFNFNCYLKKWICFLWRIFLIISNKKSVCKNKHSRLLKKSLYKTRFLRNRFYFCICLYNLVCSYYFFFLLHYNFFIHLAFCFYNINLPHNNAYLFKF